MIKDRVFVSHQVLKTKLLGGAAGSVDGAFDSWSGGYKLKPHDGHRTYLKNERKGKKIRERREEKRKRKKEKTRKKKKEKKENHWNWMRSPKE